MDKFNYTIKEYSLPKALLWGNCVSHWNEAETGNLKGRKVHRLIAIIEAVPLLGQLASLIEYFIVTQFGPKEDNKSNTPSVKDLNSTVKNNMDNKRLGSEVKDINSLVEINTDDKILSSFNDFIKEFESEILPIYKHHEDGFDKIGIHGRLHVSRAVLFAELMARYLIANGQEVDLDLLRRTTGLHDSGRKANGIDKWEKESADILKEHLINKGMTEDEASEKSQMIVKKSNKHPSIEAILFSSADSVDIMRPCTGHGGRQGFNKEYFLFLKGTESDSTEFQFREDFIEEAWLFIQETERMKKSLVNAEDSGYIGTLLNVIRAGGEKYPILSNLLTQTE